MSAHASRPDRRRGLPRRSTRAGLTLVKRRHVDLMRVCSDACRRATRASDHPLPEPLPSGTPVGRAVGGVRPCPPTRPPSETPVRFLPALTRVAALGAAAVLAATTLTACGDDARPSAADNPYGLLQPGVLRVGTLSDAPPSICIKDGQFTGFDNELLPAVADKLGLQGQLRRHRLLRPARPGRARSFDVGSSSITTTDARRRPSASPTATTSATSRWSCRPARRSPASTSSPASGSASCRAPCRRPTSSTPGPRPGEVPRLQHRLRQPQDRHRSTRGSRRRRQAKVGTVQPGDPAVIVETPSAWTISSPTRSPRSNDSR